MNALATFPSPDRFDEDLFEFVRLLYEDATSGFKLSILGTALTTLSNIKLTLSLKNFKTLADISSLTFVPAEINVLALEAIDKRLRVNPTAVTLSQVEQIWYRLDSDWRKRDLLISILTQILPPSHPKEVHSGLQSLLFANLKDSSSFVRASSLKLLSVMVTNQIPFDHLNLKEIVSDILENDTEAIARRAAYQSLVDIEEASKSFFNAEELREIFHQKAAKDLDWEVREISFKYWEFKFKQMTNGSNYNEFISTLSASGIVQALAVFEQDYDERPGLHKMYLLLQSIHKFLIETFPSSMSKLRSASTESLASTRTALICSELKSEPHPTKRQRHNECNFERCLANPKNTLKNQSMVCPTAKFILKLATIDFASKLRLFDEYCDLQQGLSSILQDILQSESSNNLIDLIDCV